MTIIPPSPPAGWHVERRDVVPSTQSVLSELLARELLTRELGDRQVVIASMQTAGRGRAANSWESPRGGLWCSFSLIRDEPPDPFLGLIVARAAQRAVQDLVGKNSTCLALKWPNDLVVGVLERVDSGRPASRETTSAARPGGALASRSGVFQGPGSAPFLRATVDR